MLHARSTRIAAVALGLLATLGLSIAVAEMNGEKHGHDHAKTAAIGETAPDFELESVLGDQTIRLSDYQGEKVVVITFHSINCPWYKMRDGGGYDRILAPLAKQYDDKDVVFLGINSNKTESVEQVASYATEHDIPYPIVKDPGAKVADMYGAKTTPHFYVVDKQGTLRYMGGYEQVPTSPEKCGYMEEQYLVPVIEAVLAGDEVPFEKTKSKGCTIKR